MVDPARNARERADLGFFFSPRSIAVVGAAREPGKVGRIIFENLAKSYKGELFAVNPKAEEILGYKCYSSLSEIGKQVELAIIAVPARFVPDVIKEAGSLAPKGAMVISAGFKETGIEGAKLEAKLMALANDLEIRILGPNCLGLMNPAKKLNASFAGSLPKVGKIAFMSQSGALCTAILDWANGGGVGFSKFISLGNKADIDEIDMLPVLANDPDTNVITTYLEGIKDGRAFIEAAYNAGLRKPVVALKAGTTSAGARAVSSHTGTLAGSENVYNAAFKQCGVIRAANVEDLFDLALGFSEQPLPRGRRLAIVTNAGGPGIVAADAVEQNGLTLANFDPKTVEALRENLPAEANVYNPVDLLGDALAARYGFSLDVALDDENTDGVIVLLTPQAMTEIVETAKELIEQSKSHKDKPVLTCFMGQAEVAKGISALQKSGLPNFVFPERAVSTIAKMAEYAERRNQIRPEIKRRPVNGLLVEEIINAESERGKIVGAQALKIVEAYGIRGPKTKLVHTIRDALSAATELKYPVVLKASSPDILHKSDIGVIKIGIADDVDLRRAYREILSNVDRYLPEAELWGITVQEMVQDAREVILGMNDDPQFGPVIMFGLGGVYVEVLKDVSFRLAPLTEADAREMVLETRSFPLLQGVRGQERSDIEAVIDALIRLSQLVVDWPQIKELDINPLMVLGADKGAVAADVRILLEV